MALHGRLSENVQRTTANMNILSKNQHLALVQLHLGFTWPIVIRISYIPTLSLVAICEARNKRYIVTLQYYSVKALSSPWTLTSCKMYNIMRHTSHYCLQTKWSVFHFSSQFWDIWWWNNDVAAICATTAVATLMGTECSNGTETSLCGHHDSENKSDDYIDIYCRIR